MEALKNRWLNRKEKDRKDFVYQKDAKLVSSNSHFRLLELQPSSSFEAPIECNISCHPISGHNTPFKALSYTWGSSNQSSIVTMNQKRFRITPSLDEALRHLRHDDDKVTLWIDQMCINQKNDDEKSDQVRLMTKIYPLARQVLVWLGPAADNSDQVMELLSDVGRRAEALRLIEYSERNQLGLLYRIFRGENSEEPLTIQLQDLVAQYAPRFLVNLSGITALFRRPWFRRVWVVQEFALGRNPILMCGSRHMDPEVARLAMVILKLGMDQVDHLAPGTRVRFQIQRAIEAHRSADTCRKIKERKGLFEKGFAPGGGTLYEVLCRLYVENEMDATDTRDRIFAVQGLAADLNVLGLRIDYSIRDYSLVLTRVARAMIQSGQLGVLSLSKLPRPKGRQYKGLPSWVPDWRSNLTPSYYPRVRMPRHERLFTASKDSRLGVKPTDDEKVLGLSGCVVDIVEETGREIWCSFADLSSGSRAGLRVLRQLKEVEKLCMASASRGHAIYETETIRQEAAWRIPIGGLTHYHHSHVTKRATESLAHLHKICIEHAMHLNQANESISDDARYLPREDKQNDGRHYRACMGRMDRMKAFLTSSGYVGIGPRVMKPGDQVVIFSGGDIPHVVRQDKKSPTKFRYLGDAYCDGIMDGEVWGLKPLQDFYLI